jgi:hypothetical protein
MIHNNMRLGGVVTFWTCGEWSRHEAIATGLTAHGFEKFVPDRRGKGSALRDALEKVCGGPRVMVRPTKEKDGFCVVEEERRETVLGGNSYQVVLTARIEFTTSFITFDTIDDRAQKIVASYNEHLGLLRAAQVSSTVVAILDDLGGTRLRPSGGVYWLPEGKVDAWAEIGRVIEGAGHGVVNAVYLIRHDMDSDAVRAVRDAIVAEVAGEAARISEEVYVGNLGERALEHRKEQALGLRSKIELYESLLDCGLESLRRTVDETEQIVATAALMASAAAVRQTDAA